MTWTVGQVLEAAVTDHRVVVAAIAIFAVTYAFIATEKVHRVAAALGGVAAMTLIGLVDADSAFFDRETGVDWNVIFLLFGMMVIVGILKHTGLFEALALWAARTSRGDPQRLLALTVLVTAVPSPILDNVTTVLLVTPVILQVCARLGLAPAPYLMTVVFAANIGGMATLIGDPPNIIIASRGDLTFNDFLVHSLPITVVLIIGLVALCRLLFRRQLDQPTHNDVADIRPAAAITDVRRLVRCLVVLALVMVAFSLHHTLHLDPSIVAMLGAGAMVVVSGATPEEFLAEIEWTTLAFFMALFVLVGGLVEVGVIGDLGRVAADAMGEHELLASTVLLFGSAVVGGFVDNIPYTAATVPIVDDMVAASPNDSSSSPLWWSFVLGADLGGNTTAVAAGANVVVLGLAARAGHPISFWTFTRYGIVVTASSLVVGWIYVWLRYFVF
ncbi:MAG TPA: ArsB/NhaD family transporter [Nocardioides sp.]|uniref:SLC13 family permease n=1 Tax=uncultured Nocardioides sp. TaxID=198441 RepID=UPI002616007F|nr:ArsB/NhaD family transporter [uncultured Nocardioides sp.]HRD61109.1 ArsB/NhaD family transporter [Nocardioides sp.]HRI97591.1 ArsB/NhaD family transporter [Nocardioides sp.]HRK44481.1 ArsB/NhaD family transporter [Nocardioides sp.]